jgi:hypothetical protein
MIALALLTASNLPIDDSRVLEAIHRTRYQCDGIAHSEYLGEKQHQQEFSITCSDQTHYLVTIDQKNQFRVWKK